MVSAAMRLDALVHAARELLREIANQLRNVGGALAQRRQRERENAEPVIQVAAKLAVGDHLGQIAIGGRHQPDVHFDGPHAAQPLELVFLKSAQQLRLQFQRNVAHFVQEQRALVGQLEAADFLRDGSGERALFVAEQLAFEQAGGDGGAVELDEGALAAAAQVVNGAGDQLLAGAGFAQDQDRGIGGRHGGYLIQHFAETRIVADDLAEILLGADFIFQVELLFGQLVFELGDLLECGGVFDRDGGLRGHLGEEVDVGGREGVLFRAADVQRSEHAVARDQRNAAEGFEPRCHQPLS